MSECPRCGNGHEKPGTFCSRKCANARQWNPEDKERKSLAAKRWIKNNPAWLRENRNTAPKRIEKLATLRNNRTQERFIAGLIKDAKTLKKWLIKNGTKCVCDICKMLSEWNNKPLVLHLDHIDGNTQNNFPINLRLICPNCHSQTITYAGKNIKLIKARNT